VQPGELLRGSTVRTANINNISTIKNLNIYSGPDLEMIFFNLLLNMDIVIFGWVQISDFRQVLIRLFLPGNDISQNPP